VRRDAKASTYLLAFFGDNSYGFYAPRRLEPFAANYQQRATLRPRTNKAKVCFAGCCCCCCM
jgi:hypothetical protein